MEVDASNDFAVTSSSELAHLPQTASGVGGGKVSGDGKKGPDDREAPGELKFPGGRDPLPLDPCTPAIRLSGVNLRDAFASSLRFSDGVTILGDNTSDVAHLPEVMRKRLEEQEKAMAEQRLKQLGGAW